MGTLHHPVTTSNPEAQEFFDQGLRLIYDRVLSTARFTL